MTIEKFTKEYVDLTKKFQCGNIVIDNFLKGSCALNENQGITYIMLSDKKDSIIGYYNIEVGRIDQIEVVGHEVLYKPMGGAVNINYLAIHSDYQGIQIAETEGKRIFLGDILLGDCEKRVLELRKQVGIAFVTLCSTEKGYHLYSVRNSYEDFDEDMNNFVQESDRGCYKLYKCIDDMVS
ncbi:MAG: hypothetical protein MRZ45_09575 [Blautia sp.]|nr:hypothetical protein [Blautia sp.]MDY4515713.1 hypothetical protein [Lachnospiraceae bacterium]